MAESFPAPSRRRFVQGLALAGAGAVIGRPTWTRAQGTAGSDPGVLTGDRIDLTVGRSPVDITGRRRMATAVNGSVPAPTLRLQQGDTVTINVTNRLDETTSIHWHGFRLPNDMDGVPGLTYAGIRPGETFTYRFPIVQSGTFFYHGHSGMQEQTGLYGPALLIPSVREPYEYDREYIVVLSDWTDEDPDQVAANLKRQGDYYNFHQRTLGDFLREAHEKGLPHTWEAWATWAKMRMDPTDIMDVSGSAYTFLLNGQPPARNWTAFFKAGERIRLRFINAAAMSTFDVMIPDLPLTVVAADGSDVRPVTVDEFRIGVAETYDVIVEPRADRAYAIFAQAEDRTGYARGTLAPRPGMSAPIPAMDPRPLRTMADMGMGAMGGMKMGATPPAPSGSAMAGMPGMDMPAMPGMDHSAAASSSPAQAPVVVNADGVDPRTLKGEYSVDNMATHPIDRLGEAGDGLDGNGRKVLVYTDLRALEPDPDTRPPDRELVFHLTGNMERFIWGFDGKKFSQVAPVHVKLGERIRFTLINDTMMEHPIHLHGFLFSVENGQDGALPLKHTITVKPGGKLSFIYTADTPGRWAFHCHLMYHMEDGMFRTVLVA
ncbi:MAG: copper resistance system multicopper oxidase [Caulobacteraceae bacterium]|nr:copper resistance system multicopper oxidase [Caulobacteraceae bacterium]